MISSQYGNSWACCRVGHSREPLTFFRKVLQSDPGQLAHHLQTICFIIEVVTVSVAVPHSDDPGSQKCRRVTVNYIVSFERCRTLGLWNWPIYTLCTQIPLLIDTKPTNFQKSTNPVMKFPSNKETGQSKEGKGNWLTINPLWIYAIHVPIYVRIARPLFAMPCLEHVCTLESKIFYSTWRTSSIRVLV